MQYLLSKNWLRRSSFTRKNRGHCHVKIRKMFERYFEAFLTCLDVSYREVAGFYTFILFPTEFLWKLAN